MMEKKHQAALRECQLQCRELQSRLELLKTNAMQLAHLCRVLGGPFLVEPRADCNPGGPHNPLGEVWLRSAEGAEVIGHSVRWSFADGLRQLTLAVDQLSRVSRAECTPPRSAPKLRPRKVRAPET